MWSLERLLLESSLGNVDQKGYAKEEALLWKQLGKVPRSLDMSDAGGTNFISMDLDKVSYRFLAAGGDGVVLHDTARFKSDEPYEVLATMNHEQRNLCVSDLHWFPHDTGMVIVSLVSGSVLAWDLNSLESVQVFDTRVAIACHALNPSVGHENTLAVGTANGLEIYDFRDGKRQMTMRSSKIDAKHTSHFYVSHSVSALAWDCHRSSLITSGTSNGQVSQWDLRQPKRALFTAPPTVPRPSRINKIVQLPGQEGSLPCLLVHVEEKLFRWSTMDRGYTQVSTDVSSFDLTPDTHVTASILSRSKICVDETMIAEVPGVASVLVNPMSREIYAYEVNHEKLLCFS